MLLNEELGLMLHHLIKDSSYEGIDLQQNDFTDNVQ